MSGEYRLSPTVLQQVGAIYIVRARVERLALETGGEARSLIDGLLRLLNSVAITVNEHLKRDAFESIERLAMLACDVTRDMLNMWGLHDDIIEGACVVVSQTNPPPIQ